MPRLHRKTAKGSTEIETRAHRLPPRLRTVLLMVDGKRNDDELVALLGGSTAETLAALAEQGFIESVGADAAAPAPADAAAAGAARPGDTEPAAFVVAAATDLAAAKRDAVRALSELLGPAADSISVRMEKAASFEELHGLVQRAAQLIAGMRGRALAEAYWMRFGPRG